MRGKLSSDKPILSATGITPADAGKTPENLIPTSFSKDHPRRCGENYSDRFSAVPGDGSPPQMRGKPAQTGEQGRNVRITPADAGKTKIRKEIEKSD